MAELIGLLGIGLAAPGVVDSLFKASVGMHQRIQNVRHYDANLQKYHKLGHDMSRGIIKTQVQLVTSAINDRLLPKYLADEIDQCFKDLIRAIIDVDDAIQTLSERRTVGKLQMFFLGRSRTMAHKMATLEEQQRVFERLSNYVHIHRASPPPFKLDGRDFCVRGESEDHQPKQQIPASDVYVSKGDLRVENALQEVDIVLEARNYVRGGGKEQVESDIRLLVGRLQLTDNLAGIPKCVGYRENPYEDLFEIVFKLPKDFHFRSLSECINVDPAPPLEERISICQMLASSVSDIHGLNLVHKNIRPRNILSLTTDQHSSVKELLFMDWTLVRERNVASRFRGESHWQRVLYQHPTRHGEFADERYSFAHDIYSIGVCMLEVLLWQSLLVNSDEADPANAIGFSKLFQDSVFRAGEARPEKIPVQHLQNAERATRYPDLIFEAIRSMAGNELPRIVGSRITEAVLQALGHAGEIKEGNSRDNRELAVDDSVNYLRDILSVVNSVSV